MVSEAEDRKFGSGEADEDVALSKETIEDLEPNDQNAGEAKGGASRGCKL